MNRKPSIINKSKGFTLIELLVVIAIIGVLATFIVASFANAQARSRDARRKSDLDAFKKALLIYKNNNTGGFYPTAAGLSAALVPNYISVGSPAALPADPSGGLSSESGVGNDTTFDYVYTSDGNGDVFTACTGTSGAEPCNDFRIIALMETEDDQFAASRTRCPIITSMTAYDVLGSHTTYVVCPD